ncbi:hypothetical protein M1146_01655 [Patescibacteria group bacterium]|nr:hypothetical protein [Patescibacteria group bacterium]
MEEEKPASGEEQIVHSFDKSERPLMTSRLLIILGIVILVGIGSGYLLSRQKVNLGGITGRSSSSSAPKGTVAGSNDTTTFKDITEGVLKTGGTDGEGAYHLVRPGGDSQNVYLTSSIVDLSKFIDKKIKVWGQTQKAQHAGWLMDVGKIEVLE